jgi:hypothetical protein
LFVCDSLNQSASKPGASLSAAASRSTAAGLPAEPAEPDADVSEAGSANLLHASIPDMRRFAA